MLELIGISQNKLLPRLSRLGVRERPEKELDRSYYSSESWSFPKTGMKVTFSGPEVGPLESAFPFRWLMAPVRRLIWPRLATVDSLRFYGVPDSEFEAFGDCPEAGIEWEMSRDQVVEKLGTPTYTRDSYAKKHNYTLDDDTPPWIRYDDSGKGLHFTFDTQASSIIAIQYMTIY